MEHIQTPAEFEARWSQWQAKNRLRDAENAASRARKVKLAVIAVLGLAVLFRAAASDYDVAMRALIAVGSLLAAKRAYEMGQFAWAGVFALVVALWNPLAPAFVVGGAVGLGVVLATMVVFAVGAAQRPPVAALAKAGSR